MKIIIILVLQFLFLNYSLYCQGLNVIKDSTDNWIINCSLEDSNILLFSSKFDISTLNNVKNTLRLLPDNNENLRPIFYSSLIGENKNIIYASINQESIIIYSIISNLKTSSLYISDSLIIPDTAINSISFTNAIQNNDEKIFAISTHKGLIAQSINFIKVSINSTLEIVSRNVRDISAPVTGLFSLGYIKEIHKFNQNKLLISGSTPRIIISDLMLNSFQRHNLTIDVPPPLYILSFIKPSFLKIDDSTFIVADISPNHFNIDQVIIFNVKIRNNTPQIVDYTLISNPEKFNKINVQITNQNLKGEYYIVANDNYEIPSFKLNINSKFYLAKVKDEKEIWRKSYGGDYYYHATDVCLLSNERVLVVGSIFDYYKNGFVQGFYMVIDSDGNIINKVIENKIANQLLYPNPSKGFITIPIIDEVSNFEVYNISGQLMYSDLTTGGVIDLSNLSGGVYIMKVANSKGSSKHKIVIEK